MKTSSSRSLLWIVLALVAGTSMWFYTVKIWSANQPAQFSDLYATWWATHELFLHGRNPYSPEIAHEIQTLIYGAPLKPTPDDPAGIGGGFAYPPYTAFLFWPTIYLSFSAAQKAFICVSVIATLGSVWLWLRTLQFRVTLPYFLVIALLTLSSFPALQALKLQNLSLIAAALIAVTLFLLSTNRLTLAGIFLAASTFKPQFTILLIPWLALWVVGNWRRRRALAWSFLTTMLVLGLLSEWLVPGWISRFLNVTRAYRHYTYGHSLLDVWFTSSVGPFISAALSIAVLAFCSRYRSQSADSPAFSRVTSLLLAATLVAIPTLAPHTQLLLLPAFLCLLLDRDRLSSNSLARLTAFASWILLAWPWFIACGLLLAALAVPVARLLTFWELPLYTSPLLPPALLLAVACALRLKSAPPGAA
jgi:hypothetical protein